MFRLWVVVWLSFFLIFFILLVNFFWCFCVWLMCDLVSLLIEIGLLFFFFRLLFVIVLIFFLIFFVLISWFLSLNWSVLYFLNSFVIVFWILNILLLVILWFFVNILSVVMDNLIFCCSNGFFWFVLRRLIYVDMVFLLLISIFEGWKIGWGCYIIFGLGIFNCLWIIGEFFVICMSLSFGVLKKMVMGWLWVDESRRWLMFWLWIIMGVESILSFWGWVNICFCFELWFWINILMWKFVLVFDLFESLFLRCEI